MNSLSSSGPIYPVDPYCPLKGVAVYKNYICMLNQTDISTNKNKFYAIQLLTDGLSYHLLTRYGRVGEKGKVDIKTLTDSSSAHILFEKVFKTKTGYPWNMGGSAFNNPTSKSRPGKYTPISIEVPTIIPETPKDPPNSKLVPSIQSLIGLISNRQLLERTLELFEIDTQKLPLGKISNKQIEIGQQILDRIQAEIGRTDNSKEIISLSSDFWTIIPFATKRNRPPPIIDNLDRIRSTADLLENLKQIGYAGRVIEQYSSIDEIYLSLKTEISSVEAGSPEWAQLDKYIKNTHALTHNYKLKLINIFRIVKNGNSNRGFESLNNHKILFHGSRMTNFIGILSEGLRIPHSEQVSNGSMLGVGIYFADSISKSFNYCYSRDTSNKGFVLLCEVALGNTQPVYRATSDRFPPLEYQSRTGIGQSRPDPRSNQKWTINPTVEIPSGKLISDEILNTSLLYNEYVIFSSDQYRFRYLVELDSY